jgi:hypothetical protein
MYEIGLDLQSVPSARTVDPSLMDEHDARSALHRSFLSRNLLSTTVPDGEGELITR